VVTEFRKHCDKEIIACVAGKGSDRNRVREQLATLVSAEVSSILAVSGNGLPDLVAPGKDGLYLFMNEGK
jgi:5,10-methylenetetrahydrofolate reductase